jgi:hypothetical protein
VPSSANKESDLAQERLRAQRAWIASVPEDAVRAYDANPEFFASTANDDKFINAQQEPTIVEPEPAWITLWERTRQKKRD